MPKRVNRVQNPDFRRGRAAPTGWRWEATAGARWERPAPSDEGGVTIRMSRRTVQACWSQVLTCKPGEFYRVDAVVRCKLDAADERCGFFVSAQAVDGRRAIGEGQETPGVQTATRACTVRAFFQAPVGARRVRLSVGVQNAKGWATVESVRFLHILEPEEDSHLLAIPPPPYAIPAPRTAKTVCIGSATAPVRSLTAILGTALGKEKVTTCDPVVASVQRTRADAILLPDSIPPRGLRKLDDLFLLAEKQMVVLSLPAFARLAGKSLSVRHVEQPDDPICAKVVFANHVTRGFALHDVLPFAWGGRFPGSFAQNHFRKTPALDRFLKRHGFTTLLTSMACQDVTTGRPVCLYKETSGGGLFVVDLDPVEAESSTRSETNIAVYFLLSILGHMQNALGQFVMPVRSESRFRETIREAGTRFREFAVHDGDVPVEAIEHQLVTIGREDESYGLPLKPKPLILVRSGLQGGDAESVCGSLLWFKQLLRMPPHACSYADALASRFRLAWVPCAARWERRDGWRRSGSSAAAPMSLDVESGELSTVIDVVSIPRNECRVVLACGGEFAEHVSNWLPRLQASFRSGRYFAFGTDEGAGFSDRDRFVWRAVEPGVRVVRDESAFTDGFHREALRAGAQVVRFEVPGSDADFVAQSIHRTDFVATLLEQVIGLQYGLIAVNRTQSVVRFDGFAPVGVGEALVVGRDQTALRAARIRAS